jgi:two-component system, chemotaxis family, protein-glutamate methylesterase/glutaminase
MIELHQQKIRVLVVDDSAFMRSALKGMINADPELEVVSTARDGAEAIEKIERFKPDIVTMDMEMPRMDGLTALGIIMEKMPLPVIVVSSLTTEDAEITLKALDLGAVDFICKDLNAVSMNIMNIEEVIREKLKVFARNSMKEKPRTAAPADIAPVIPRYDGHQSHNIAVVAIGVSTGGPKALQSVIPVFPKNFLVPVLVVQHMPVLFTKSFAERLDAVSNLRVKEAETGDLLEPGKVYIARGGIHMKVKRVKLETRIFLDPQPEKILYHPSVNIMMWSAVEAFGGRVLGVVMTGMGDDGTEGMRAIKQAGGKTLAQDEASCVVWGMPRSAVEAGVVDKEAPLTQLTNEIINMV